MSALPQAPPVAVRPDTTLVAGCPGTAGTARVAVCVPVYQGGRHLVETLDSVLDQSLPDVELVVLDNASTDTTPAVLARYHDPRLVVWRNAATVPMVENVRRVVALSHAPLVKILPADDVLRPGCLETQVAALAADPGLALVVGRQDLVDERGRMLARARFLRGLVGVREREAVIRRVVRSGANPIGADGAATFRRDRYDAAGGYPGQAAHADLELWLRLLDHGAMLGQPETVLRFRVGAHAASAADHRADYRAQRSLTRSVVDAERSALRRGDILAGTVSARLARARRALIYRAAEASVRLRGSR